MPTVIDKPSFWQKLLGIFIVVQFTAIFISNFSGFFKSKLTGSLAERYLEVTGQPQGWGMFEAGYMQNSVAWDVRIELEGGRIERVGSVAKLPQDVSLWNPPAIHSRRFVYESSLLGIDVANDMETINPQILLDDVRNNNSSYLAFFRTLYERARKPDWPALPKSMEMVILRTPIEEPRSPRDSRTVPRYVCRWQPGEKNIEFLEVEAYDLDAPNPPYRKLPR